MMFPVGFIIQTLTDEIIIIIILWMNGGSIKFYCMEIKKLIPLFDEIRECWSRLSLNRTILKEDAVAKMSRVYLHLVFLLLVAINRNILSILLNLELLFLLFFINKFSRKAIV